MRVQLYRYARDEQRMMSERVSQVTAVAASKEA